MWFFAITFSPKCLEPGAVFREADRGPRRPAGTSRCEARRPAAFPIAEPSFALTNGRSLACRACFRFVDLENARRLECSPECALLCLSLLCDRAGRGGGDGRTRVGPRWGLTTCASLLLGLRFSKRCRRARPRWVLPARSVGPRATESGSHSGFLWEVPPSSQQVLPVP